MIHKKPSADGQQVIVTFEIPGTIWAERINLVGDFNDWDQDNIPFQRNRRDNWQVELALPVGHEYRFRYLFDGRHWRDEWQADKYIPNNHGSFDSIIVTTLPSPTAGPAA
ncbi:MAG: isoamylase early set domain-containing protein [Anaerolineae bacterium]